MSLHSVFINLMHLCRKKSINIVLKNFLVAAVKGIVHPLYDSLYCVEDKRGYFEESFGLVDFNCMDKQQDISPNIFFCVPE